ncbi:putative to anthranilate synthase component II [Violaceomyces palustris]|uniref:To anthranilate synthase component II n=1 Tax=Violaceomyces palustris TaxID=1673888 RepID=A0ACD0P0L8_9BASI|nr:putative to anthranilate synthase component II [Violaceomyces palustris]
MPEVIPPKKEVLDRLAASGSTRKLAQGKTVFIDNYDSFTYNIVQFLAELGADLVVFRNDKVTIEEIQALNPVNIVISPGPGHPLHDSGISIPCIKHFAGKVPILGVCMGLQCLYSAYTGIVDFAGEILHGKTSPIEHDGKGLYAGLDFQGVIGTRYHSLAAQLPSLPQELVVTSKTESGVVMGIRHTRFAIEAVQYHPESILSVGGREMLANFLSWTGPTWADNPQALIDEAAVKKAEASRDTNLAMNSSGGPSSFAGPSASATKPTGAVGTILERIHEQRLKDIAAAKAVPGFSQRDLDIALSMHLCPPQINFPARLTAHASKGLPGVMAEMKRASPSKGDIDPNAHAGAQALAYARGGASVISVLTEPKWFKGTLNDLSLARKAIDNLPNRPAILRKDFIVDTYQIAEARLAGADTVLLIVAMLTDTQLKSLYDYSVSLGMEPLVEVNNPEEMKRALDLGSKVIGVNNRNLHDFNVDMGTTSRLAEAAVAKGVILCALSGISGRKDVEKYVSEGVGAVLVGEALMRAADKQTFIRELLGLSVQEEVKAEESKEEEKPLVKICGLQTAEAAVAAAEAGADMLGLILAPGTKRTLDLAKAKEIIRAVRSSPAYASKNPASVSLEGENVVKPSLQAGIAADDWFTAQAKLIKSHPRKPLMVGVFRDQPLEEVREAALELDLDAVQLHGRTEWVEWSKFLPGLLVFKIFHVGGQAKEGYGPLAEVKREGYHHLSGLDTAGTAAASAGLPPHATGAGNGADGGTGVSFDWSIAKRIKETDVASQVIGGGGEGDRAASRTMPLMLAGGLRPDNVAEAVRLVRPFAVDTSSGVEKDGAKDLELIRRFVEVAKSA